MKPVLEKDHLSIKTTLSYDKRLFCGPSAFIVIVLDVDLIAACGLQDLWSQASLVCWKLGSKICKACTNFTGDFMVCAVDGSLGLVLLVQTIFSLPSKSYLKVIAYLKRTEKVS